MNRKQKLGNVLIISSRKRMLSEFQSYLHSVLGEYLTFNTLLREQATDPSLFRGYQCVLFPSVRAMETFPLTLDSSILQLPCDRVFNHMFLDKIIQIPPHERVYLVNDDKYSTLAIISQLEECGITQYDFVPFYPGCKDTESDIQFAITAGEPQLVPSRIPNVLDIGNRIIDISTILQLCEYFNIPLQTVNRVSRNYVNQILHTVKTSETYYTNYVQTEQLMQVILFSLPIGICLFGADGRIQFMNAKFAHAFSLPSSNFEGQPFSECLPPAYADTAFDRNGDWTILLSDQKTQITLSVLSMVFPDTEPVFLAFLPESRSMEMSVSKDEKTEESTFFASSRTFSLSLSHADSVQNLMAQARHLALFDFPILIQGESGTQRRTLARAIHNFSRRHHYPFSVLHSPGNDLTEASLLRLLAETNHGTLVLSQVDRFPLSIQDLLVNVLTNVHGNFFSAPETRRFDVRIIAIADDNLYKKVEKGTFLRELFHLLSASELQTVPIRRRREDIPDLLNYFLLQFFHNTDMTCDRIFSEGLLRFLKEYAYPGNIHELYNLSCSLFTRYSSHKLQLSDLPTYLRSRQMLTFPSPPFNIRFFLSYRRIRKQAAWQSKTDWPTEKPLYPKRLCAPYSESFLPPVISSCTGQKADVKFPSWGVWFWKNNLFQKSRCFQKFGKAAVSGSVQASFFLCGYHRVQDRFLHSLCRCFKCLVDFFFFYPGARFHLTCTLCVYAVCCCKSDHDFTASVAGVGSCSGDSDSTAADNPVQLPLRYRKVCCQNRHNRSPVFGAASAFFLPDPLQNLLSCRFSTNFQISGCSEI